MENKDNLTFLVTSLVRSSDMANLNAWNVTHFHGSIEKQKHQSCGRLVHHCSKVRLTTGGHRKQHLTVK